MKNKVSCTSRTTRSSIYLQWSPIALSSKDKSQRHFYFLHSRWPNVTSHAPMEFKWRASGRQNLAVGLVKFHKGEKGRPTDIQSYTSYKYCSKLGVFITKMIYKQKFQGQWILNWRFKFVWKARRKRKNCWTSHEETCQSIFKILLRISATWSLQWVCKTTIPDSTYFELQVVIAVCYLGEPQKKSF